MWLPSTLLPPCSPFYLLDAHEELAQPGVVYLFGKASCSDVVQLLHLAGAACCWQGSHGLHNGRDC